MAPKPFAVEYAKSGRAACKICKNPIAKDALRIAKVVQSRQFDGYMTMWHHYGCLLKKTGVFKTLHDVEGSDNLRWEDQKKLEKYVQDSGGSLEEDGEEEGDEEQDEEDKDFSIEYAKSSRSTCKECEEKIQKDEVRVSKLVESDNPQYPGMVPAWRHIKCFLESGLWSKDAKKLPGIRSLTKADREAVEKLAKGEISEMPPKAEEEEKETKKGKGKKRKTKGEDADGAEEAEEPKKKSRKRKKKGADDDDDDAEEEPKETKKRGRKGKKAADDDEPVETKKGKTKADAKGKAKEVEEEPKASKAAGKLKVDPALEKALEKQSRALWEIKDALRKHVSTSELREMLEVNGQSASGSEHELRDRCADGMLFGPLGKCPLCSSPMEYKEGHYCCRGFLSEWTKCTHTTEEAPRLKAQWKLPENNDNEYLDEWFQKQKKSKQRPARILPPNRGPPPTEKAKTDGGASGAVAVLTSDSADLPLTGMTIAVAGHLKHSQHELKDLIEKAGGKLATRLKEDVSCLVTTPEEAEKEKGNGKVVQARELRIPIVFETFLTDSVEKKQRLDLKEYMIENKGVSTVKVKGRSAVHEASGLQETGHILEVGKSIYNTTLNLSDMASGINSYYILQIIEEDSAKAVHVFRKWGRVGSDRIGSQKLERLPKQEAVAQFKRLFREKTGNDWEAWEAKDDLHKVPGKFYPLDIDYGVDEGQASGAGPSAPPGSRSKLDPRVVDLMKMLFDLETYRATMLEFEINLAEMPLGKISKKQVTKGFEVLSSIQALLQDSSDEPARKAAMLVDASNQFYTLVPAMHPNPISDEGRLKEKIRMLEALRDIEIASRLIGDLSGQGAEEDPLDVHYRQLQCAVDPMPRDHPNWGLVQDYLHKTHAPTHKEWNLELEDVFCLDRSGEADAYQPFKSSLPNKMLLWHGSRTSNYVGILSQGLRIAPPEAPVTGYMFGKGIYFADLVSKSAQYCYTSRGSPVGLMLLCEVALGEMHELRKAQYMDKAPRGKHSTKGLGKMVPDASEFRKLEDEVTVPVGKPVPSNVRASELMYNEYIVYDTSQVRMRYLLKVRFKHK